MWVPRGAETVQLIHSGIGLVQIVLELRDQLGRFGAAALDAVADVQDDQPVVPVAEVRQAVRHRDVVDIAPGLGLLGLPPRHFLRLGGVADVDDPHRARGVVGEVDMPL